jgi:uncharacterized protein involved in exopolysaccharide biosynthesis
MDIALSRREVASILFKNLKRLSIIFVCVFAVLFGGSYVIPPTYKAESEVLIQSGREYDIPTEKGDSAPTGAPMISKQEIINSEVEILSGHNIAEDVVRAVGLARIYPHIAEDGFLVKMGIMSPDSEAEKIAAASKKFSKKLKITPVTMSNIITLDYWNPDRDVALEALQKLTEIYQEKHANIFGNRGSVVLGQQTTDYEKQLVDVTGKITVLKNSRHLSDITYERQQLILDRSDVEAKLRDLKAQSIESHRALDYYRRQLASMPELVLMNENSADAVETAKSRLLDLNTQLMQLKQRFVDGNPDAVGPIQDLESQAQQIKAFINDTAVNQQKEYGRNLTYDDARMKLQNAEAAVPAVDQKIDFETSEENKILGRLQALDDGEAGLEVLTREQDTLRELVHNYRDRYEEARSAGNMDKERVISVTSVSAPESELDPDKPKHLIFAAAGVVAGMMAAGLTLLYFLIFRDFIITTESLERTLGLRVLGAVPDLS